MPQLMPIYWVFYFLVVVLVMVMGVILFGGKFKIMEGFYSSEGGVENSMKWFL